MRIEGTDTSRTGYETDSLVPFVAYLGLGLLPAVLHAAQRARRGQHRGQTLVSMAVALAATVQGTAFALNPVDGLERGDDAPDDVDVRAATSEHRYDQA